MARYKTIDTRPRFIAVDLQRQLLPGSFEHALNYLVDHELDLARFDARYKNDLTGASAYPPAMLLKVVLFAYSRGIVSSREIERACKDHVTFIVLSGDSAPHFTTFAAFVSTLGVAIASRICAVGRKGGEEPSHGSRQRPEGKSRRWRYGDSTICTVK